MIHLKQFIFQLLGVIILANIIDNNIWFVVSIICLVIYSNIILYQEREL